MALYRLERFEDAVDALNKADEAYDDCFVTMKYRGMCHYSMNHMAEAIRDLSRALKGDPNDTDCLIARGEVYREIHKYELALHDFEMAGKLTDVNEYRRLKNIGLILLEKKKYKQAAKKFVESLSVVPECDHCWHSLISTYEKFNPKNTIPSLVSDKNFPKITFTAMVYFRRGRALGFSNYVEAIQDIRTAIQLDPSLKNSDEIDLNELGLMWSRDGKYEEAIECFDYAGEVDDYVRKYNIAVAKALWKGPENATEEIQQAEKLLKELVNSDNNMLGIVKYGYAGLEAVRNNKANALSLLREAIDLDHDVYHYAKNTDAAWKSLRTDREFIKLLALNK